MRPALFTVAAIAALSLAGVAQAERVCTAPGADPAVTVSLRLNDDGAIRSGEVHWAVPNTLPGEPSMVHIVYPLEGDHAGPRPVQVITLNAVTGEEFGRSPTASIQIVVDGMDMAVRAWELYGQAVAQLNNSPPPGGVSRASFVGAVQFSPQYDDGRRDIDSSAALAQIGRGAHTLQVRLLGQDGGTLQDHTYQLSGMPAPPIRDVQVAAAAVRSMAGDPSRCQAY